MIFSGLCGWLASRYILGLATVPSLFIAIALTATSVGISVAVWEENKLLKTRNGELLVDIAEMDDISGIIMMALAFAMAPRLESGIGGSFLLSAGKTLSIELLKLFCYGALCVLFARYAERPITQLSGKFKTAPDPMITLTAVGFVIAALAGLMGFSLAIGAFFAGLVFSRDPAAVKTEASFSALYEFFTPFFFIEIGYQLEASALPAALGIGAVLLIVAVVGKVIGTGGPAIFFAGSSSAALLSVSMVPRAEIAMVISQRALKMSENYLPQHAYTAMVIVSIATCIASPIILRRLLDRFYSNKSARS
jgi:Kef-type K+ transport system membrane component KefB